jgi:cell division initiation protein
VPITPADIQEQRFRIVFRGYDVEAVDAFLDQVHDELVRLTAQPPDVGGGTAPAAPTVADSDPATDDAAAPSTRALRTLQRADQMADQLLVEATAEADQIRAAAQAQAEQLLEEARTERDRIQADELLRRQRELHALSLRCEELHTEIDGLGTIQRRAHASLRAWLSEGQELLERHPVVVEQEVAGELVAPADRPALAS